MSGNNHILTAMMEWLDSIETKVDKVKERLKPLGTILLYD